MRAHFAVRPLRFRRSIAAILAVLSLAGLLAPIARAERQSSMNLFPHDTLLFVRTGNANEFSERLKDTGTGRMLADPQIKPFIDRLLGEVSNLYAEQAAETVGLSWEELLKLPKGEIAFGIVAQPNASPALLLMVDQAGERSSARALLDRALEQAKSDGVEITKETIESVEVTVLHTGFGRADGTIGVFERDGTIVAATDADVIRHVLWHWEGDRPLPTDGEAAAGAGATGDDGFVPGPTFDKNEKFIAILQQLRRPTDPPPNLIFYVDPIGLMQGFGRANPGMQIVLAFLPRLGLDGLQAIGGAMTVATGQFDGLSHVHVLLQNPRAGVLSMIAFGAGDTKPQNWVPLDVTGYTTLHWDFQTFYKRLAAIVDRFQGEGAFDEIIADGPARELGIDFKTEIVDNLAGRVTLIQAVQKPYTLQSGRMVFALEVVDEAAANQVLQKFMNRAGDQARKRQFGPVSYYALAVPGPDQIPEEQRPMQPFFAVMDKHFFVGTSYKVFEEMIAARQGDAKRLVESVDYNRFTATLSEETRGMRPVIVSIARPVVTWRFYYELLKSEQVREMLDSAASDNPVMGRFAAIVREGALPPFEVLEKYFGPSGGILYDTDNGFHGISFTLRGQ